MKSYKKILELHNKKACDVCGAKCDYYYNDKFELEKTECIGYKLAIRYVIFMKISKLFRRLHNG